MNKTNSAFIIIGILASFSSCRPEPEPCFRVNVDTVFVGEPVQMENCSEDGERFEWNFEHSDDLVQNETNTTKLTEIEPSFTWFVPGAYNVSLTAYSKKDKKSAERSKTVVVYDRCFTCTRNQSENIVDTVQTCSSITFFNEDLENYPTYIDSGFTCTVRTLAP